MTTTGTELEARLQDMIDARLDAIDRVLLRAGVSRGERRRIVDEVEAQVYELLARRAAGDPTRADVAAVLDSLDPPEAYAPEGYRQRLAEQTRVEARPRVPQPSFLAVSSAVGGVLTLLLGTVLAGLAGESDDKEFVLLAGTLFLLPAATAVTACGVVSIRRIRRSGGWLFGLPAALFAALLFPLLITNLLLAGAILLFEEVGLIAAIVLAFLGLNLYVVSHLWRWVSAGYRRATPTDGAG
jgi:hypothetical protein